MSNWLVRCLTNSSQSVVRKLCDGCKGLRPRGMSRVVSMGRWSVLGPWRLGLVLQLISSSEV